MMNDTSNNLIYIEDSEIEGKGIFAKNNIEQGTTIFKAINDNYLFSKITENGSLINHSYYPNTKLKYDKTTSCYYIVSTKYIEKDEEVTANYDLAPMFILPSDETYIGNRNITYIYFDKDSSNKNVMKPSWINNARYYYFTYSKYHINKNIKYNEIIDKSKPLLKTTKNNLNIIDKSYDVGLLQTKYNAFERLVNFTRCYLERIIASYNRLSKYEIFIGCSPNINEDIWRTLKLYDEEDFQIYKTICYETKSENYIDMYKDIIDKIYNDSNINLKTLEKNNNNEIILSFSASKETILKHSLKTYKILYNKLMSSNKSSTNLINFSLFMNNFIRILFEN